MSFPFYIKIPNSITSCTIHTLKKVNSASVFDSKTNTYSTVYGSGAFLPIPGVIKGGYKVKRAKLWGSDTGRTMTGGFNGTLIGIFPKVTVEISCTHLQDSDIKAIIDITDVGTADCKYYEQKIGNLRQAKFYFEDVDITYRKNKFESDGSSKNRFEKITITAIACEKYS